MTEELNRPRMTEELKERWGWMWAAAMSVG